MLRCFSQEEICVNVKLNLVVVGVDVKYMCIIC